MNVIIDLIKNTKTPLNGQVDGFKIYNGKPETFFIEKLITLEDLKKATLPTNLGISRDKKKDSENLLAYVSVSDKQYYKNYLQTVSMKQKVTRKVKI